MYKRRSGLPAGAGLILMAAAVRLTLSLALPRETAQPLVVVEDVPPVVEREPVRAAAQDDAPTELLPIPVQTADKPVTLAWSAQAAQSIALRNHTGYTISLEELAAAVPEYIPNADSPTVLIVHTHTTEAYTPEPGWEYDAYDVMRSMDSSRNMVAIGDEVERVLSEAGIWVIHDETVNDYPSYNDSYTTAGERIAGWLARYPGIQMVLDLHRDAAVEADGSFCTTSCTLGGVEAAQLMLVCGSDYGGRSHPNWRGNLAFAVRLQLELEAAYPGICRPLDLRVERFNLQATPMSLLVEVGTAGDTLRQALPAAHALGETLAALLMP